MTTIDGLFAALAHRFPGCVVTLTHVPAETEQRAPETGGGVMALPGVQPKAIPAPAVTVEVAPARWIAVASLPNPAEKAETVGWTGEGREPAEALAKLGGFAVAVAEKLERAGVWDPPGALADALGRIV